MSKIIIGIHGLGNKPPKKVLEKWWLRSIKEGLYKIKKPISDIQFEMAYWADILYESPLDYTIKDKKNPLFLEEKYRHSPRYFKPENHDIRQKILDSLDKQLDKLFLNDDLSINFQYITDIIIHAFFRDLESYYSETKTDQKLGTTLVRYLIRKRIQEVILKYRKDEIIIIAHSMGSIITYDVLSFAIPEIKIDMLITMGSPLGFPVVKNKIISERNLISVGAGFNLMTPENVSRHWYNLSDLRDKVALMYDLTDDYKENSSQIKVKNFIVNNDYINNGKSNPHKSYGYLRTPEFAEIIYQFLERPDISWINKLKMKFNLFR